MARYDYGYPGYGAYGYGGYGYGGPGYYTGYGPGYGYTGWGARAGYDRGYRRPPQESPNYGRGADRAARRYARSHGYDAGYALQPNRSDRFGGYYGTRDYAGRGGYGRQGYRGWNERDYDWEYRW